MVGRMPLRPLARLVREGGWGLSRLLQGREEEGEGRASAINAELSAIRLRAEEAESRALSAEAKAEEFETTYVVERRKRVAERCCLDAQVHGRVVLPQLCKECLGVSHVRKPCPAGLIADEGRANALRV